MSGWRRTAWVLLILTVPTIVVSTQLYVAYLSEGVEITFASLLVMQSAHWYLWAAFGPMVWRLATRWPLEKTRWLLLRHIGAAVGIAVAFLIVFVTMVFVLIRFEPLASTILARNFGQTAAFIVASYFHIELLIYGVIVAVSHLTRTRTQLKDNQLQALQLRSELSNAKLQALRAQLQPHFLFNTLHTIGSLVMQRENDRAVSMLARLGELLRMTLAHRDAAAIPLAEELAYVRSYVDIEQARFGDRVAIGWSIDEEALNIRVPTFILQPIVENAFRHGIATRTSASQVTIKALVNDGMLHVSVYNDGPALPEAFSVDRSAGFGLRNVTQRLATWDQRCTLTAISWQQGVRVTLTVPSNNDASGA